jgi:hypothetical protein
VKEEEGYVATAAACICGAGGGEGAAAGTTIGAGC